MLINQEEGGAIEDYFLTKVRTGLHLIEETATDVHCDSEMLKESIIIAKTILTDFEKFVLNEEKKLEKQYAKNKVLEKIRKGENLYDWN